MLPLPTIALAMERAVEAGKPSAGVQKATDRRALPTNHINSALLRAISC